MLSIKHLVVTAWNGIVDSEGEELTDGRKRLLGNRRHVILEFEGIQGIPVRKQCIRQYTERDDVRDKYCAGPESLRLCHGRLPYSAISSLPHANCHQIGSTIFHGMISVVLPLNSVLLEISGIMNILTSAS